MDSEIYNLKEEIKRLKKRLREHEKNNHSSLYIIQYKKNNQTFYLPNISSSDISGYGYMLHSDGCTHIRATEQIDPTICEHEYHQQPYDSLICSICGECIQD